MFCVRATMISLTDTAPVGGGYGGGVRTPDREEEYTIRFSPCWDKELDSTAGENSE